jgi:dTDP-4-dehydrorhamnose 3,5-epimerase
MTRSANSSSDAIGTSLLEQTLAAADRDKQTVTSTGERVSGLIEGVSIRPSPTHIDQRGSVVEVYDLRWNWHPDPLSFIHCFTIRPGFVKGWGLHKEHEDRYFIISGEMDLVLFDPRPKSSTYGRVCRIAMSDHNRCLVNIPTCVWHAEHNVGNTDVVAIDLPTKPYQHDNPDKYRLPINTPLIPYSFGDARGW